MRCYAIALIASAAQKCGKRKTTQKNVFWAGFNNDGGSFEAMVWTYTLRGHKRTALCVQHCVRSTCCLLYRVENRNLCPRVLYKR
jgi:hypothetical protein